MEGDLCNFLFGSGIMQFGWETSTGKEVWSRMAGGCLIVESEDVKE